MERNNNKIEINIQGKYSFFLNPLYLSKTPQNHARIARSININPEKNVGRFASSPKSKNLKTQLPPKDGCICAIN
ncbi:MAG: hypothetical protein Q8M92_07635, partial [Candidatus Subteraquimicrobiales bacterium]|nr:hypothetical protein [Candidatus Subteraquimicrobiales bacterium]